MKPYLLLGLLFLCASGSDAQILKKLKDKISNTVDKKTTDTKPETVKTEVPGKTSEQWCKTDTIAGIYESVYSSTGKFSILYDESCLGLGADAKGYSMVIRETTGGKSEYVVIENGKETGRYPEMKDEYIPCRKSAGQGNSGGYGKYVIADSTKFAVPGSQSQTINTKNIDAKKAQQGMEIAKQTDEYKKMSPEEKKQFDELMKNMPALAAEYNNNVGNKTIEIPGNKAVSGAYVSGYRIVVNKKEYGKFTMLNGVFVSSDEKNVFALGVDQKSGYIFLANDKKFVLTQKGFTGSGRLISNAAVSNAVYAEMKQKTAEEMEKDAKDFENAKYVYRILKRDGSVTEITVTGNFGNAEFKLANNGSVVYVNPRSGEIFADGKLTGKFKVDSNDADALNAKTILLGDTPDKICYYSSDGSLNYPDGTKKNMGIFFPSVSNLNGKSVISWFRKCNNEIYIGKMSF